MRFLVDLLYPPRCILCYSFLPDSRVPVCDRCAGTVLGKLPQKLQGKQFRLCVAPFSYQEPVRSSIHRYKFSGKRYYAKTYGKWLAACIRQELEQEFDLITWVPVSRKRRRKRGYDQAEVLARAAAENLQVPVSACLVKIRDNPAQSTAPDADHRRKNVMGVYAPCIPERYSGKRILLVDDVTTTGATMEECAKMLCKAGAAHVVCAALAMTK